LKKHILFIIPVPLLPLGAGNYNRYRIIKQLCKQDYDITLICPQISRDHRNELDNLQQINQIKVLDRLKLGRQKGLFKHLRYILHNRNELKSFLETNEISLIHCVNPPDLIPLISSTLALSRKIPFIFHIADPGPESMATIFSGFKRVIFALLSRSIENWIINRSSGIITVNYFLKNHIIKTRSISEHNFEVVYNIPSTNEISVEETKMINNSLIYIGTLHAVTGLDIFIENFKCLKNWKETTLFIVGDGPQMKDLKKLSSNLALDKNIIFKGHIEHQQAMQLLNSSTLAIIPYLNNPLTRVSLPTKLFEYIKLSKTLICPNLPGFTEILGADNPGLYDINDKLGIYNTIQTFMDDQVLVKKTELLNSEIANNFVLEKEISKIKDLYGKILN
jgi:glycosyltransferase involved in cell wall biosynthesis